MMFTIDRDVLSAALGRIAPFADSKSPIPILGCVKLVGSEAGLSISATDMDAAITETLPLPGTKPGAVCVSGDRLKALVAALRAGASVEFTEETGELRIRSGRTTALFETRPHDDYPEFRAEGLRPSFAIKASELDRVLAMTIPSMSTDPTRHYLGGLFLSSAEGGLVAAATDGSRLACARPSHDGDAPNIFPNIILPRTVCARLRALLKGSPGTIEIAVSETRCRVSCGAWSLVTKLIDGTFPEYQRVMAPINPTPIMLDAGDLLGALGRIESSVDADSTRLRSRGVHFDFAGATARLWGGIQNGPGVRDELDINYSGEDVGVGFNSRFLRDAVAALDCDGEIELHVTDANSPVRVCRKGDAEESITVMPYRI